MDIELNLKQVRAREMPFIDTISRKVVTKNLHGTIPKGNMGYNQCTVPDNETVKPTQFCCFPLASANIHVSPWPLMPFFQISLKDSELKTIHLLGLLHDFFGHLSRNSCIQTKGLYVMRILLFVLQSFLVPLPAYTKSSCSI